jgi:hypothetical protein
LLAPGYAGLGVQPVHRRTKGCADSAFIATADAAGNASATALSLATDCVSAESVPSSQPLVFDIVVHEPWLCLV